MPQSDYKVIYTVPQSQPRPHDRTHLQALLGIGECARKSKSLRSQRRTSWACRNGGHVRALLTVKQIDFLCTDPVTRSYEGLVHWTAFHIEAVAATGHASSSLWSRVTLLGARVRTLHARGMRRLGMRMLVQLLSNYIVGILIYGRSSLEDRGRLPAPTSHSLGSYAVAPLYCMVHKNLNHIHL